MLQQLVALTFSSPLFAFAGTFLFFCTIYFAAAGLAFGTKATLKKMAIGAEITGSTARALPAVTEIKRSLVSVFIFALQTIILQQLYQHGYMQINLTDTKTVWLEILILFLWNEVHFYIIHWLLHRKFLFKRVHFIHHQSFTPTPFSTYSFHWAEAFLLGTVIFVPVLLYDFHLYSILALPVMSLLLNVFGHWNYDLFASNKTRNSILDFSYRHSFHHQKVKGNYGFLLPFIDMLFRSNLSKNK